jgi:hypothetical protein
VYVNCKSANIIYILECSVCGLQYIGESKQPFHKHMNGHRSDLTKKPFLPVSQHFELSDHSLEDFNRMKILVIEQNCLWSDFQRENREIFWIKELRRSRMINSSCSTSGTRCVNLVTNPVISYESGKNREVFATSGTYPWSFVTQIFHNGQPSHGGDRKPFEIMTTT